MKKLIKELKTSKKIKTIYATTKEDIILVENAAGSLCVINAEYDGYQWSTPIKPKQDTGSGIAGTDGHHDTINMKEMLKIAETKGNFIPPYIYTDKARAQIEFWTIDQKTKQPVDIFRIKIK